MKATWPAHFERFFRGLIGVGADLQAGSRGGGTEWKALCPAHDDTVHSLSIGVGRDGRLIIRCHSPANCAAAEITAAVGCTLGDLYPDEEAKRRTREARMAHDAALAAGTSSRYVDDLYRDLEGVPEVKREPAPSAIPPKFLNRPRDPAKGKKMSTAPARVVKAYDYRDEQGNLLFQVCRTDPKGFRQRRPNPAFDNSQPPSAENPPYLWNVRDVRLMLYNVPAMLAAWKDKPARAVFLCYTADTEILTESRGWVRFPELTDADRVAQYDADDGSITFTAPRERQVIPYSGPLVSVAADFSDLMVTPEHRQLTWFPRCSKKIVRADQIRQGHRLPVAGVYAGKAASAPSESVIRLMVAWQADGVNETRGEQVSWNLKKDRKKLRLRELLTAAGVSWTEHNYPSTPGWTSFRVRRQDMAAVLDICPEKAIPTVAAKWPHAARVALLEELGFWDGDFSGTRGIRYFTNDENSANAVQTIAALTGYGSIVRKDERRGSVNYVVNLIRAAWRVIGATPEQVSAESVPEHTGAVYCCTVETGLIVVRRNGKVVVSGNCEGEKDADLMTAAGLLSTTMPGGAFKWRAEYTAFLKGRHVVVIPDEDPIMEEGYSPGIKHATEVCNALVGVAASVRMLRLPGVPPKGDFSDWWALNQVPGENGPSIEETKKKFGALVVAAPEWKFDPTHRKAGDPESEPPASGTPSIPGTVTTAAAPAPAPVVSPPPPASPAPVSPPPAPVATVPPPVTTPAPAVLPTAGNPPSPPPPVATAPAPAPAAAPAPQFGPTEAAIRATPNVKTLFTHALAAAAALRENGVKVDDLPRLVGNIRLGLNRLERLVESAVFSGEPVGPEIGYAVGMFAGLLVLAAADVPAVMPDKPRPKPQG